VSELLADVFDALALIDEQAGISVAQHVKANTPQACAFDRRHEVASIPVVRVNRCAGARAKDEVALSGG
jgi:hypothetical protein